MKLIRDRWDAVKDWAPPVPAHVSRRALIVEIIIVLMLSLGKSGVGALLRFLRQALEAGGINRSSEASVTMSGLNPALHPVYDVVLTLVNLVFWLAPVGLAVWLLYNSRTDVRTLWFKTGERVRMVEAKDFVRAGLMMSVVGGAGLVFYAIAHATGFAAQIQVGQTYDTWRYWFHLLTDAAGTSILEECLVVGYFLVRLRQLGVGMGKALTGAAVLRGSYHLYQGLWGFVGNFVMGLAFGYLYARWGRITPLVLAHFFMDTVAFVGLALGAGALIPSY